MPNLELKARVTSVRFRNYKALQGFHLKLRETNILVGPNNAGKSTMVGAFRALAVALRRIKGRKPEILLGPNGRRYGVTVPGDSLPISIENVHTDYLDEDTLVSFALSNGNELQLYFPQDGSCSLIAEARGVPLLSAIAFQKAFPLRVAVVPILGPVEHKEELVQADTVQRNLTTHRASRNFRSYWYHFPEGFDEFADLVRQTWPGIEVEAPRIANHADATLSMFCTENRILREIYWVGSGFQIWCQLLTHLLRAKDASLIVIDEPEVYLHADLQRQLIGLLRSFDADVLLATHSTEIMAESEPTDLVLVDKKNTSGERIRNVESLQKALASVGSLHNITLSRIARSRKILFVEGDRDLKVTRMIARQLGLHALYAGLEIVPAKSEGFGSWAKVAALGWGMKKALGDQLAVGALFDRDYYSDAEISAVMEEMQQQIAFAHIHGRKEIENYLLLPLPLERALQSALADKTNRDGTQSETPHQVRNDLMLLTEKYQDEVLSNRVGKEIDYRRRNHAKEDSATLHAQASASFKARWKTLDGRLELSPGKAVLADYRALITERHGVSLSDSKIISAIRAEDVPQDFKQFLERLDEFRVRVVGD